MQMVAWHEDFCRQLAAKGFHVVRFDNRDVGHSTHTQGPVPSLAQLLRRSKRAASFTLADMADDAAGLLSKLKLVPAHVIGVSMGGMIAQTLAARHPQKVRSLVSIMSNTGSRVSGQPAPRIYPIFLRRPPAGRDAFIAHSERLFAVVGSPGIARDPADIRAIAAESYDRDHDPSGTPRQLAAIIASGNRTAELHTIRAPTLVIHGKADPLVSYSGGRATARAITGAKLLGIEAWVTISAGSVAQIDRRDRRARRAGAPAERAQPIPTSPPRAALGPAGSPPPSPPAGLLSFPRCPSDHDPQPLVGRRRRREVLRSNARAGRAAAPRAARARANAGRRDSASGGTASGREAPEHPLLLTRKQSHPVCRSRSRILLDPKPVAQAPLSFDPTRPD